MIVSDRLALHDSRTELQHGSHPIPAAFEEQAKRIAGVAADHDGLGDYPLGGDQARKIGALLAMDVHPKRFDYFLELEVWE
ncbi:MAG TPA: hypothetical protein VE993_18705 [Stellaceae bacterium]|nr:hypothetical protein [Stellaceae bacterium]